jgi:zinc protease
MVDLRVVFDAGSARDEGKPGLAAFTAAMLTEGARDWSADAIADRLEGVGAELSASADRDMTAVGIRSLTREPALSSRSSGARCGESFHNNHPPRTPGLSGGGAGSRCP